MRTKLIAVSFLAISWMVTLLTPALLRRFGAEISTGPSLPFMLTQDPEGCVRSSPLHLLLVIGVGATAAALAEVSKAAMRSRLVVPAVAMYQLAVVLDCLRAYAWDWWTYFYIVGTGGEIDSLTWMDPVPVSGATWPWISGVVGCAALLVIITRNVTAPPNSAAEPDNHAQHRAS